MQNNKKTDAPPNVQNQARCVANNARKSKIALAESVKRVEASKASGGATLLREGQWQFGHPGGQCFPAPSSSQSSLATAPENEASKRLALKCGFKFEGTLRGNIFHHGQNSDSLLYSLLRAEAALS